MSKKPYLDKSFVAVNPSGDLTPLQIDAQGNLKVGGITLSGDVSISDVAINNTESNPVPVTGPLTDTQLRAAAVPVSGPVTDTQLRAAPVPVSGPLTDTQLRASAVPVSATALPLPTGAATEAQIGEVQASPTANTVLDRLKTIAGKIPGLGSSLSSASLPVVIASDQAAVPGITQAGSVVGSNSVKVGVEFTRPSNTDAYIARDVVCNSTSSPAVITFANFARVNEGSGIIVKARLFTDKKDVTAQFRLHLFHTAPTAIADNAPYTLLYANAANRIGQVDFPAMGTEDATNSTASATMRPSSDGSAGSPNLWFQAASGSRAIYGVLETLTGFTPASGQKFYVELAAILD